MKSDRIQVGPPGKFGQLLTVTVEKTIVTIKQDGSEDRIELPTMAWSDLNAVVVRLVAELNAENDRSKTDGKTT